MNNWQCWSRNCTQDGYQTYSGGNELHVARVDDRLMETYLNVRIPSWESYHGLVVSPDYKQGCPLNK
jgi:hypothetical protein